VLADDKQVRILFCFGFVSSLVLFVLFASPNESSSTRRGGCSSTLSRCGSCFVLFLFLFSSHHKFKLDKKWRVLVDDKQVRIRLCVVCILHCLTHTHRVITYVAGNLDRAGTQSPLISPRTRTGGHPCSCARLILVQSWPTHTHPLAPCPSVMHGPCGKL
jgi:hypothetical protein